MEQPCKEARRDDGGQRTRGAALDKLESPVAQNALHIRDIFALLLMEAEADALAYRSCAARVVRQVALGEIVAAEPQQIRIDRDQCVYQCSRAFGGVELQLLNGNVKDV